MTKKNKEYSIPQRGLSKQRKDQADQELKILRFKNMKQMKQSQKIYADIVSLKFNIIDYLELGFFSKDFLFSEFLKKYVSIVNISRRKLAEDLSIHETKFSRIINNKENPGIGLLYRIEEHSNGLLPASLLWQLVVRKMVVEIDANDKEKNKQSKLVKNRLKLKTAQMAPN